MTDGFLRRRRVFMIASLSERSASSMNCEGRKGRGEVG